MGKESACNAGDTGAMSSIPGWGRAPGGQLFPAFLPGESYGLRTLVGDSPWGHKESGTTGRLMLTYLPVFLVGESHGQWSLVGYSPWGCRDSDMTEHARTQYVNRDTDGTGPTR